MKNILRFFRNLIFPTQERRFQSLMILTKFFFSEYRFTWPQMLWWKNIKFNKFLFEFNEVYELNTHRKWMLSQLLRLTVNIPGDTAECGAYKGASSWLICNFVKNNKNSTRHYVFDSFEGLSKPCSVDGKYWKAGDLSVSEDYVLETLKEFSEFVEIKKGWIPERFSDVSENVFSFVHVDVDLALPTKDSIEFFYDRLSPGAVFLCDDYGFDTCPGVTSVIDEFLHDKPEKMLQLDAGGGFFIKRVVISEELYK